jgi:hypothetical protein
VDEMVLGQICFPISLIAPKLRIYMPLDDYVTSSGSFLPKIQDNLSFPSSVGFLTPEDGTDRLSRNIGKKLPYRLRNNPGEHSSHLLQGGSLESRSVDLPIYD